MVKLLVVKCCNCIVYWCLSTEVSIAQFPITLCLVRNLSINDLPSKAYMFPRAFENSSLFDTSKGGLGGGGGKTE